ncbi:hypothetical protein ABIF97_004091 [Bradyrhizobium japonicum]
MYDRRDLSEVRRDLAAWFAKWGSKYPKLTGWVEENIEETLTYFRLPLAHRKHMKSTDEMDKRFLMITPMTIAEIASILFSAAARAILPSRHRSRSRRAQGWSRLAAFAATARLGLDRPEHGGILAWNGTAFLAGTCRQPMVSGAGDLVAKRDASAESVSGPPILSCRAEAPARRVLAAAVSIATPIVRSFAPPGRQSTSHGWAAP